MNGAGNQMSPVDMAGSPEITAWRRTIGRLPPTLRPVLSQQLADWKLLFPFEQNKVGRFFRGVNSFTPQGLDELTAPLRIVETKMGIAHWRFSEASNTMEDSAQLARSAYYSEWRAEVQRVYAAIDARASQVAMQNEACRRSLILLILPENLPVDHGTAWTCWGSEGRTTNVVGDSREICDLLLAPQPDQASISGVPGQQGSSDPADLWLIDGDTREPGLKSPISSVSFLSYATLKPFREKFLTELNTIPKDMTAADDTMAHLRSKDWGRWCSPDLAEHPELLHFVIELFLSGNGALIFPGAFVEWAASEALRRARPRILMARFGMRSKPKPFTGIAIFENQETISSVPDTDDPVNSAIDAAVLAHYVWLAASRYAEYGQAVCLCVAEHLNAIRMIAPPGSGLENYAGQVRSEDLCRAIKGWLTA
jgi:hypothetical protein